MNIVVRFELNDCRSIIYYLKRKRAKVNSKYCGKFVQVEFFVKRNFFFSSLVPCTILHWYSAMDALQMQYCNEYQNNEELSRPSGSDILYPCSIKTREVLGNPSPMPKSFPELEGRGKSRGQRGWISQ